jgi:hypothetical protein
MRLHWENKWAISSLSRDIFYEEIFYGAAIKVFKVSTGTLLFVGKRDRAEEKFSPISEDEIIARS